MTSNTYEDTELKAMDLIQDSLDVKAPLNQEGMPGYYHEKIYYLKSAIELLETQIQEYETQSKGWAINSYMNNSMEGGKKHKKTRKTKKSKKNKRI